MRLGVCSVRFIPKLTAGAIAPPVSRYPRKVPIACPLAVAADLMPNRSKGGNGVASELSDDPEASCQQTVLDLYRSQNAAAPRDRLMSKLLSYVYH